MIHCSYKSMPFLFALAIASLCFETSAQTRDSPGVIGGSGDPEAPPEPTPRQYGTRPPAETPKKPDDDSEEKPKEEEKKEERFHQLTEEQLAAIVRFNKRGDDAAQGLGFFTELRGKTFIITSWEVVCSKGFDSILDYHGNPVEIATVFYGAVNNDAVFLLPQGDLTDQARLVTATASAHDLQVGAEVAIPTGDGWGFISAKKGRILAFGAKAVRHDVPYQRGASGSPVIDIKSGEVIAIEAERSADLRSSLPDQRPQRKSGESLSEYTARRKEYSEALRERSLSPKDPVVAHRFDSVDNWQRCTFAELSQQQEHYKQFANRNKLLDGLFNESRSIFKKTSDPDLERALELLRVKLSKRVSDDYVADAFMSFSQQVQLHAERELKEIMESPKYDYVERNFEEEIERRNELLAEIREFSNGIRNYRYNMHR